MLAAITGVNLSTSRAAAITTSSLVSGSAASAGARSPAPDHRPKLADLVLNLGRCGDLADLVLDLGRRGGYGARSPTCGRPEVG